MKFVTAVRTPEHDDDNDCEQAIVVPACHSRIILYGNSDIRRRVLLVHGGGIQDVEGSTERDAVIRGRYHAQSYLLESALGQGRSC